MKILFTIVMLLHGLIHVMGFAKAFHYGNDTILTKNISKPQGVIWLVTATLFFVAPVLFLSGKTWWQLIAIIALLFSQVLIIRSWQDAKYGTIANIVILAGIIYYE